MPISIRYHQVSGLPGLSWLAHLSADRSCLTVVHGSLVECRPHWLVEGVWDGDFEEGGFHRSENFFGSGVRVDGDRIYFVPSSALVDRLLSCEIRGHVFVSNSLALLLSATAARVDPHYNYRKDFRAILAGVRRYKRDFHVLHPVVTQIQQVFFDNLVVSKDGIAFERRSNIHQFDCFGSYYSHISGVLDKLRSNLADPNRVAPMRAYTTLSRGYDSVCVSVLARRLGIDQCFTSDRSNNALPRWISGGAADDDGGPIAGILGMATVRMPQRRPVSRDNEFFFLAGTATSPELVFDGMCQHIERTRQPAVVFTGYHGDKVWDASPPKEYLTDEVIRQDISGLGLTEVRLKAGFINLALPFIGARNITQLAEISRSDEMRSWRLGGTYDRPIARRIVESAGVPRALFGMRKRAVVNNSAFPMTTARRREFLAFIRRARGVRSWMIPIMTRLEMAAYLILRARAYARLGKADRRAGVVSRRIKLITDLNLPSLRYVWATEELCGQFRKILATDPRGAGLLELTDRLAHSEPAGSDVQALER